jgi:hypothetical protein
MRPECVKWALDFACFVTRIWEWRFNLSLQFGDEVASPPGVDDQP